VERLLRRIFLVFLVVLPVISRAVLVSPASAKVIAVINLSNLLMRGIFLSTFIPLTSIAVFASPTSAKVMAVIILSNQLMFFSIFTPPYVVFVLFCCWQPYIARPVPPRDNWPHVIDITCFSPLSTAVGENAETVAA
jgi:hypothetical protein